MARFIVKFRFAILAIFLVALIGAGMASLGVVTNYEMSKYLSKDMPAVIGMDKTIEEFGIPTTVRVMIEDVGMVEAVAFKEKIKNAPYVQSITWLDDVADIYVPIEMMDERIVENFYKEGSAIYTVYLDYQDYSTETGIAVEEIKKIVGDRGYVYGAASSAQEVVSATERSVGRLILLFLPVVFIILILATHSFFEPIVFFITLGFAIGLNTGSNLIFGEVSFVTHSMASALQLAISMDYSIFLLHRFAEEKARGLAPEEAMIVALDRSFSTIVASAVTTIAGFSALLLMQFKIGTDMGLVFGKGIIFSLLCSIFLLPAVTMIFSGWIDKLAHRRLLPNFKLFSKVVFRLRYVSLLLIVLIAVPAVLAEQRTEYIYGGSGIAEEEGTYTYTAKNKIEEKFGAFNPVILLLPKADKNALARFAKELSEYPFVDVVQTHVLVADNKIPEELLPEMVRTQFISDDYYRIIVGLSTPEEGPETFEAIEWINNRAKYYYDDAYYIAGLSVTLYDIRDIAGRDTLVVTLTAIVSVAVVVLLTFKKLMIPVILLFCIEAAVFINMAIPYFADKPLVFVGKLIVSSLMLGATIDYAILLTSRYVEHRERLGKKAAFLESLSGSAGSIVTSALVLTVSGFLIQFTSDVKTVSEMGELIGRGAILSATVVMLVLPAILYVFDRAVIGRGGAAGNAEIGVIFSVEGDGEKTESKADPERKDPN